MENFKKGLRRIVSINRVGGAQPRERKRPIQKSTEPPPNFDPQQIQEQGLSELSAGEAHMGKGIEGPPAKPVEPFDPEKRVIPGKKTTPYKPQFSPQKISSVKMADDWERAKSEKGRPPIGGAQDD